MVTGRTQSQLAQSLSQAARRVVGRIEEALAVHDVSLDQWRVLSFLGDGPGRSMSEIARYAMVPAPTLTKIVDKLVEGALVQRRVDDADRRRVLVLLSPRGRTLHRMLAVDVQLVEQAIVEQVGPDDAERFQRLLDHVLERLG